MRGQHPQDSFDFGQGAGPPVSPPRGQVRQRENQVRMSSWALSSALVAGFAWVGSSGSAQARTDPLALEYLASPAQAFESGDNQQELVFVSSDAASPILPLDEEVQPQQADVSGDGGSREVTFIVSPYVWIPTVSGDIDVGTQGIQFELDAGDLLDVFEFGGLIRGEMRHSSGWGLAVDYVFADLGADVSILIGDVAADIDASILEATVVRRVQSGQDPIDIYGGIRRWDAAIKADITIPFLSTTIETGDDWVDPIIGARYQHSISRRWRILGQLDVGGFGIGSDFTWNAALGVSYAAWENTSFQLVYRTLSVDRQSGATDAMPGVGLEIVVQGPLIGFAYQF